MRLGGQKGGIILAATVLLIGSSVAAQPNGAPTRVKDLCPKAFIAGEARLQRICKEVHYLGFGTFTEVGVIPAGVNVLGAFAQNAQGRDELVARRHFFAYRDVVLTTLTDGERQIDMVVRGAAAVEALLEASTAIRDFMTGQISHSASPPLADTQWKNRAARIIMSFDKTPQFVGASVNVLGPFEKKDGIDYYSNYAIISIDEETILGTLENAGSRRIYKRASADENYRLYMADGLQFTVVHELAHRYVDYLNSTSRIANAIYQGRPSGNIDAEEIIANESAMALLRAHLSAEQIAEIVNENTILIRKAGVRAQLATLAAFPAEPQSVLLIPR